MREGRAQKHVINHFNYEFTKIAILSPTLVELECPDLVGHAQKPKGKYFAFVKAQKFLTDEAFRDDTLCHSRRGVTYQPHACPRAASAASGVRPGDTATWGSAVGRRGNNGTASPNISSGLGGGQQHPRSSMLRNRSLYVQLTGVARILSSSNQRSGQTTMAGSAGVRLGLETVVWHSCVAL